MNSRELLQPQSFVNSSVSPKTKAPSTREAPQGISSASTGTTTPRFYEIPLDDATGQWASKPQAEAGPSRPVLLEALDSPKLQGSHTSAGSSTSSSRRGSAIDSTPASRRSSTSSIAPSLNASLDAMDIAQLTKEVRTRSASARRSMSFLVASGAVGSLIGSMVLASTLGPGAIPAFFLMWLGAATMGYLMSKYKQQKLMADPQMQKLVAQLAQKLQDAPADMSAQELKKARDIVGFCQGNVFAYGAAKGLRLLGKPLKIARPVLNDWIEPMLTKTMNNMITRQAETQKKLDAARDKALAARAQRQAQPNAVDKGKARAIDP